MPEEVNNSLPGKPAGSSAIYCFENRLAAQDGVTLIEVLIVSVMLVIVVGALTQLFISTTRSQSDQTNRVAAQQDARVALNKLRREIHCGSAVSPTSAASVTVTIRPSCFATSLSSAVATLPQSTISVGSTATFPAGPNTIRFGSAGPTITCNGPNTATSFTSCSGGTGGPYPAGTTVASTVDKLVTWCAVGTLLKRFVGAAGSVQCPGSGTTVLTSLNSTSIFPTVVQVSASTTLTARVSLSATPISIPVASTLNFASGNNVVSVGSSGNVTCTSKSGVALTGCTGGSGSYALGTRVSTVGQQLATVVVSLVVQPSAQPSRSFTIGDTIDLRNSRG